MALIIESAGLFTTVQDLGRPGYRHQGVPPSGAMDPLRIQLANLLVGNALQDAALEITLSGPTIRFTNDAIVALTGADLSPMLNGQPVDMDRPFVVTSGSRLSFGALKRGARTYMSISGGIDVPLVLGSRSTYVPAKLGGFEGRPLKAGDVLNVRPSSYSMVRQTENSRMFQGCFRTRLSNEWSPTLHRLYTLRVLSGPEWPLLSETEQNVLLHRIFYLTSQSSRMGYRFKMSAEDNDLDAHVLQKSTMNTYTMQSSAVDFGTIQLPSLAEPILLMADHQTTGGYPRVLQLIQADIPLAAQLKPGDAVNFILVRREEAYQAWLKHVRALNMVKAGLKLCLLQNQHMYAVR